MVGRTDQFSVRLVVAVVNHHSYNRGYLFHAKFVDAGIGFRNGVIGGDYLVFIEKDPLDSNEWEQQNMFTLKRVVSISIFITGSFMGLLLIACHSISPKLTPITVIPVSGRFSSDNSKKILSNPTISCDDAMIESGDTMGVSNKTTSISQTTPPESTAIMFIIDDTYSMVNSTESDQKQMREKLVGYYLNILQGIAGQTEVNSFGPLQIGIERFGSTKYNDEEANRDEFFYPFYSPPLYAPYYSYIPLDLTPISELMDKERDWYSELNNNVSSTGGDHHPEIILDAYDILKTAKNYSRLPPEPIKMKEIILITEGNFREGISRRNENNVVDRMYRILHQLASLDRDTSVDIVVLRPLKELTKESKQIWSEGNYPKLINKVYYYDKREREYLIKTIFNAHLQKFLPRGANYQKYGWIDGSPINIPGDTQKFILKLIAFSKKDEQKKIEKGSPTFIIEKSRYYKDPKPLSLDESGYIWNFDNIITADLTSDKPSDKIPCPNYKLKIDFPAITGPAFYVLQLRPYDYHAGEISIKDINGREFPENPHKNTTYIKLFGRESIAINVSISLENDSDSSKYQNCYKPSLSLSPIRYKIVKSPDFSQITEKGSSDLHWLVCLYPKDETFIDFKVSLNPALISTPNNGEISLATQTVDIEVLPKIKGQFLSTDCNKPGLQPDMCTNPDNPNAEYINAANISFNIDHIKEIKEKPSIYISPCPIDESEKCTIDYWKESVKNFYDIPEPAISFDFKTYQYKIQHILGAKVKPVFEALLERMIIIEGDRWYLVTQKITKKDQPLECAIDSGPIIKNKIDICPGQ